MSVLAWWERRRGEALAWFLGMVGFAVFLAVHAWTVSRHVTGSDLLAAPWLQLGGWPFVIKTARAHLLLLLTPSWLAAIALPLALLGLAGWSGRIGMRVGLTVGAYVAAFLVVGRSMHAYWGLMYAPLLPLGAIFAWRALADLARSVGWSTGPEKAGEAAPPHVP